MKKKIGNYKIDIKWLLVVLAVVIIPKMCLVIIQNPIKVGDELGTLAPAAYFAGKNWNDMFGIVAYYGTGYHILFTPLYMITSNPYLIYRVILATYVMLEALIAVISYYISKHYLHISNNRFAVLCAIVSSYFLYNKATWVSNESVVAFISWLSLLVLFKIEEYIDNKKKKIVYSILLAIIFSYALMVHLRMTIMWIAAIVLVVIYFVCNKKMLINIPAFGIFAVIGYIVATKYNEILQDLIWLSNRTDSYLHNASVTGGISNIVKLLEPSYWHAWLNIILGQLNTASVMSMGMFIVAVVFSVIFIFKMLFNRKEQIADKDINNKGIIIIVFCGGCIAGLLGGQSITWLQHAQDSILLGYGSIDDANTNFLRVFTYMRYFAPYMGPILLYFLALTLKKTKTINLSWNIGIVCVFLLQIYWLVCVLPYLYKAISVANVYIPFSLSNYTEEASLKTYIPATIICLVVSFFFFFWYKKKKITKILIILTIIVMYQYLYYGIIYENSWHTRANSGYEFINAINSEMDIDSDIYVPYPAMAYTYQIMLPDYHVIPGVPEEYSENKLIFTNRYIIGDKNYQYEYLLDNGYMAFKLDGDEYVYVYGLDIQEYLLSQGYRPYNFNGTTWVQSLAYGESLVGIYEYILDREPDYDGLIYWNNELAIGNVDIEDVCRGFINSGEFLEKNVSNKEYVQLLYCIFLGENAVDDKCSMYEQMLNDGYDRIKLFEDFAKLYNIIK